MPARKQHSPTLRFSFFDCSSPFCFLLIEFHCNFSIFYKILPYYVFIIIFIIIIIIIIIIVFWFGSDRPSGLIFFVHAYFFPYSRLSYLLCFFVLFHSYCSHAQVFGRTLVHEFPISYSHTEWYLFFSRGEIGLALAETKTTLHTFPPNTALKLFYLLSPPNTALKLFYLLSPPNTALKLLY